MSGVNLFEDTIKSLLYQIAVTARGSTDQQGEPRRNLQYAQNQRVYCVAGLVTISVWDYCERVGVGHRVKQVA